MHLRDVAILVFPGVQTLDAVGPYEVFASATRVAHALGVRGGSRIVLASTDGQPVRAESGVGLCTEPLPDTSTRFDTLVLPGGDGARAARSHTTLMAWIA